MKLQMNLDGVDVSIQVEDEYQTCSPQLLSATSKFLEVLSDYSMVDISIRSHNQFEQNEEEPIFVNYGEYAVEEEEQPQQGKFFCRAVDTNNPAWPFPLDKRP